MRRQAVLLCCAAALIAIALFRALSPSAGNRENEPGAKSASSDQSDSTLRKRTAASAQAPESRMPIAAKRAARTRQNADAQPNGISAAYTNEDKEAISAIYDPERSFKDAESEFGVPAELLKAIAHTESGGEHNGGYPSKRGGRGLMGLRTETEQPMLQLAGQLLNLDAKTLVTDPVQNIRAAAALMRYYRNGASGRSWAQAVARYSGSQGPDAEAYVSEIRNVLTEGSSPSPEDGNHLRILPDQGNLLGDRVSG